MREQLPQFNVGDPITAEWANMISRVLNSKIQQPSSGRQIIVIPDADIPTYSVLGIKNTSGTNEDTFPSFTPTVPVGLATADSVMLLSNDSVPLTAGKQYSITIVDEFLAIAGGVIQSGEVCGPTDEIPGKVTKDGVGCVALSAANAGGYVLCKLLGKGESPLVGELGWGHTLSSACPGRITLVSRSNDTNGRQIFDGNTVLQPDLRSQIRDVVIIPTSWRNCLIREGTGVSHQPPYGQDYYESLSGLNLDKQFVRILHNANFRSPIPYIADDTFYSDNRPKFTLASDKSNIVMSRDGHTLFDYQCYWPAAGADFTFDTDPITFTWPLTLFYCARPTDPTQYAYGYMSMYQLDDIVNEGLIVFRYGQGGTQDVPATLPHPNYGNDVGWTFDAVPYIPYDTLRYMISMDIRYNTADAKGTWSMFTGDITIGSHDINRVGIQKSKVTVGQPFEVELRVRHPLFRVYTFEQVIHTVSAGWYIYNE